MKIGSIYYLLIALVIFSCSEKSDDKSVNQTRDSSINANIKSKWPEDSLRQNSFSGDSMETKTFVLYEDGINGLSLNFERIEMMSKIQNHFTNCKISKELNYEPLDGAVNLIYSVICGDELLGEFFMSEDDTLTMQRFHSNSSRIGDQYGIKIGDSFSKILNTRSDQYQIDHNYYSTTSVSFKNSNIKYEISGETIQVEDPPVPPQPKDPEMKDWKVTAILWSIN